MLQYVSPERQQNLKGIRGALAKELELFRRIVTAVLIVSGSLSLATIGGPSGSRNLSPLETISRYRYCWNGARHFFWCTPPYGSTVVYQGRAAPTDTEYWKEHKKLK